MLEENQLHLRPRQLTRVWRMTIFVLADSHKRTSIQKCSFFFKLKYMRMHLKGTKIKGSLMLIGCVCLSAPVWRWVEGRRVNTTNQSRPAVTCLRLPPQLPVYHWVVGRIPMIYFKYCEDIYIFFTSFVSHSQGCQAKGHICTNATTCTTQIVFVNLSALPVNWGLGASRQQATCK